jgi:hypothetical protein
MTTKKKNDNPNLLKRNALIISIAFNIILAAMFLLLYVPTLVPQPPMPDPFQMTATQLITTATEGAMTRIAGTPFPTLSIEEETALREQFLSEVEGELGFSHTIFEETIDTLIGFINQAILSKNEHGFDFEMPDNFIYAIERTTVDSTEYVAIALQYNVIDNIRYKGLIFRVDNGSPELLAQRDAATIYGFEDRNGNGFLDVALGWRSCCTYGVDIYEIRSNVEFVNLTENLNASISGIVDINADGILELQGTQQRYIPEGASGTLDFYEDEIPLWFFWNGEEYEPYPVIVGE